MDQDTVGTGVLVPVRQRVRSYYGRILTELQKSFHEEHSDQQIAGSFAAGIFITALPTLGTGFLVFAALIRFVDSVSKLALLASVAVMNPVVKPLVYLSSINLGGVVVTREVVVVTEPGSVLLFLLVGNLIIAVLAAAVAYGLALAAVRRFRESQLHVIEEVLDGLEKDVEHELEHALEDVPNEE